MNNTVFISNNCQSIHNNIGNNFLISILSSAKLNFIQTLKTFSNVWYQSFHNNIMYNLFNLNGISTWSSAKLNFRVNLGLSVFINWFVLLIDLFKRINHLIIKILYIHFATLEKTFFHFIVISIWSIAKLNFSVNVSVYFHCFFTFT